MLKLSFTGSFCHTETKVEASIACSPVWFVFSSAGLLVLCLPFSSLFSSSLSSSFGVTIGYGGIISLFLNLRACLSVRLAYGPHLFLFLFFLFKSSDLQCDRPIARICSCFPLFFLNLWACLSVSLANGPHLLLVISSLAFHLLNLPAYLSIKLAHSSY